MECDGLSGDDGVVGAGAGNNEKLAVGIVGIGAHGDGGRADGGKIQPAGRLAAFSAMTMALPCGMAPMCTGKRTGRFSETRPK